MRKHGRIMAATDFLVVKPAEQARCRDWYAVQVRPRSEFFTATILHNKGFEYFVPKYLSTRSWSDRKMEIMRPLFPGYIFCKFNPDLKLPIVTTAGVIRILCSGSQPISIDPLEIEAVKRVVSSGCRATPHTYAPIGNKVLIQEGPLAGLEGIVTGYKNRQLILSVGVVQRSIAVALDDCARLSAA